jgi:tetratricopeptide (TPR) repeat protein
VRFGAGAVLPRPDKISVMRKLLAALALLIASACAPKLIPAPVVTTPKYPEFIRPSVPAELADSAAAINENRGWAFLQSGDLKTAEHEFNAALKNNPQFSPAVASLGYLDLARKDPKAALAHFEKAISDRPDDVGALFGRGQALLSLERTAEALAAFEAVLAVDPNQVDVRRRVDVLRFRNIEQKIADARQAAGAGRLEEAASAYESAIASQPESPFLYRELAAVERRQDQTDAALEHLRKAVSLDPSDTRSLAQIGEILEQRGELEEGLASYERAAEVESTSELEGKIAAVRERIALAKLPEEYRVIDQAPQITRADLAALIGIRLAPLLQTAQSTDAALITDVRNSWAQLWIMSVARAGIMEPFANHAFQPRTLVRRSDLAVAAAHLLARISEQRPAADRAWENARLRFSDLAPTHLAYPAASAAVAAQVLKTTSDNAFQPSRPVTGAEAVEAIAQLESLAGLR